MPTEEFEIAFDDAEDGKPDELVLEIIKTERKTKAPMAMSKFILIFVGVFVISYGIAIAIARIIFSASSSGQSFAEWITIMLMILGGLAIFAGGITGVWGGQRNIPIRVISPGDSTVIGKGIIVTGYVIEDCLDNEIELTVYDNDKEVIHEELVKVTEEGLFYTKLEDIFNEYKKSIHIVLETWMVSSKSKKLRFLVKEKKYDELNIAKPGSKLGKFYLFPTIYKDFSDKVKVIFDPKRKEKGFIENVKINERRSTNIFFPEKKVDDDKYVPFSFEKVAEMRQNAYYFDLNRRRRLYYGLIFFIMSLAYFLYPFIDIFV
ncbi:MAG: hypothetical protein FK730_10800 [Asgard group archaeon]|nr:hypothetical protein [Asgard group archaeon]